MAACFPLYMVATALTYVEASVPQLATKTTPALPTNRQIKNTCCQDNPSSVGFRGLGFGLIMDLAIVCWTNDENDVISKQARTMVHLNAEGFSEHVIWDSGAIL